ncbi:MAG: hypothetical protein IT431_03805 [Phycisphaerales bacterium]|nr:hypothetical protein [Phycisphaerales bacterium]
MQRRRIIAAVLAASAGCAAAQEARFLEPDSATVGLGDRVGISVFEGGAARAWPAERVAHFLARTAWTQDNRDTLEALPALGKAGVPGAVWTADRPGVLLLGLDLKPGLETVGVEAFGRFLARALPAERRGAITPALPEGGEVSVRRVESAKALVRVSAEGAEPVSIATSKTGQAVEIRPLLDPTMLTPGGDLPLKIYGAIPGPAGGVVTATNTTTGESFPVALTEDATANLTIPSAGRWRVEFHAVAPDETGEADWLVHTATLTFEVRAGEVTR